MRRGDADRIWSFLFSVAGVFLLASLSVPVLFAQRAGQANISGVVTDQLGATIPNATLTATNKDTGVVTNASTNAAGQYVFPYLATGTYAVQVRKDGFQTQVANNVVLQAEQEAGLNFTMKPGQVNEQVEVQAAAQQIETETAALGQNIDERTITELPLNGRNPASLVLLTPGTTDLLLQSDASTRQDYTTMPVETGASTSGGRQGSTVYFLDGAYNMDNYHLLAAPFPNPDATQEFKVIGNNFDSRYGFAPGGVVSIVTKSGTNNWHGDVFEFIRNSAVNATDYFTDKTDELKRNQFGVSLGGPIVRNKLFIFGNYQGTRQRVTKLPANGYIPTSAMRSGDWSAYCNSGFNASGLCLDTSANPNNAADPFVNNQMWIPTYDNQTVLGVNNATHTLSWALANPQAWYPDNFICQDTTGNNGNCAGTPWAVTPYDSASMQMLSLMPSNTLDKYGHFIGVGYSNKDDYNEETFRGDYNVSSNQKVSGRAYLNFFNRPAFSNTLLSSDRSWTAHWQSYAGTWTWTINPHIVNSFTGSYSRLYDNSNSGLKVGGKGICYSQFITIADPSGTPCSIEGFSAGGGYDRGSIPLNAQNFNGINRWTYGFSDSINISKGKHMIVAGVDVLRQYWYENTDWLALPIISFSGGPNGQFTGSGLADFLLGDMGNLLQGGGESNEIHAWMVAPYVADQIKIRPNLTVDLGLRYEPWMAPVVSGGRIAMYSPGQQSTRYPNAPPGLVFPGDKGIPSAGLPSDYKRFFDPRVGFAWQPKFLGNTSVRGAFGMFATTMDYANFNHASDLAPFSPTFSFSAGDHGTCVPALCTGQSGDQIGIIPFSNPWSVFNPTGGASPFPPFSSPGTVPGPSATITAPINIQDGFDPRFTDGRTYTWNLSIEHLFGNQWLARAAYVASESDHQPLASDQNFGRFFGVGDPRNLTRPDPNFTQNLIVNSFGTANYQSAQFTLDRKFANGLQFTANYTFSHTIDWYSTSTTAFTSGVFNQGDLKWNRSNSSYDVPHVFTLDFVYTTPKLNAGRGVNALLGAWEVSGIWSARSGNATWIGSGQNTSFDLRGRDVPDYAPGYHSVVTHSGAKAVQGSNVYYVDKKNFTFATPGTKGGIGRDPTGMFYPGWNTWDLSIGKNFQLTERLGMQLRGEAYNAFNRETMGCFDNTWLSNTFGQFGCSQSTPRILQLGAKVSF